MLIAAATLVVRLALILASLLGRDLAWREIGPLVLVVVVVPRAVAVVGLLSVPLAAALLEVLAPPFGGGRAFPDWALSCPPEIQEISYEN